MTDITDCSAEEYLQANIDLLDRLDQAEYSKLVMVLSGAFVARGGGHGRDEVRKVFKLALAALRV